MEPKVLFTEQDYEAMKAMEGRTEKEIYRGSVHNDMLIEITHRVHRLYPDQMIYIVTLSHDTIENLFNDDLYWRAEPVKFCHGLPTYEEVLAAIQKLLDYRFDLQASKSKVLNIPWDPKQPDFDS